MMDEALIRVEGAAGRITLNRPAALNALSHGICLATEAALKTWADDPAVRLVILDAAGERAFCAGGDIAQVYHAGRAGDFAVGRDFWRDEYRMNALLAAYPKPVISLMHGFVMGGGVGYGCHVSHRVVGETTQMAMPECGIGLIPDVGGTLLLARAPGRLGLHLGLTGARFGPGDALYAGFADHFVPEGDWPALIDALTSTGDAGLVARRAQPAPPSALQPLQAAIDAAYHAPGEFGAAYVSRVAGRLTSESADWAQAARKALMRNSPLSMASTAELIRALSPADGLHAALKQEFRWTWRSMDQGDFLEGVRAQIIDKDRSPQWKHSAISEPHPEAIRAMLAPLGADELTFEEERA